jgi:hypothetical protein
MVSYSGAQSADDQDKFSVSVPVTHELKATVKQTAGVGRSLDWEIRALQAVAFRGSRHVSSLNGRVVVVPCGA